MLIPLDYLVKKYDIKIKGILHVGAHECEELESYENYVSRDKILWVEAMPDKVELSKNKYKNLLIENAVVSDKEGKVKFNIANNGQSSSILNLGTHLSLHPQINYTSSFDTETVLLSKIIKKYDIPYNFVNLDIQGAELKALKGMSDHLNNVDYVYTEINSEYVYENCVLIEELDDFLLKYDLFRVETRWANSSWGDAFYIRKN